MSQISSEFIEKYQLLYEKDPNSRVFAPLAEAYRKMGLIDQALILAQDGVQKHPHFASGRVTLAKIFYEKKQFLECVEQLNATIDLSPENILAHRILAECNMILNRPREALKAYKMVLFLNPFDEKALSAIKKLELLTIQDYEAHFQTKYKVSTPPAQQNEHNKLIRALSLIDAYFTRNETLKAANEIELAEKIFGNHPEILKRKNILQSKTGQIISKQSIKQKQINKLNLLLDRVELRTK